MKKSNSYGITLLDYNAKKCNYNILMIRKKYSYNYKDFVLGSYDDNAINYKNFFNGMTLNEKEYIHTNNYDFMWYKLWSKFPTASNFRQNKFLKKLYFTGKNIFFKNFPLNYDNTINKKLINLLNNSLNVDLLWEMPKGKKMSHETNIDAAIREFKEETGIDYNSYRIIWNIKPIILSIESNGIFYNYYYYLALLQNKNVKNTLNFGSYRKLNEIADIKWVSINEIKLLNLHPKIKHKFIKFIKKAIKLYKKYKCNSFLYNKF